jgi:hypothetical protein
MEGRRDAAFFVGVMGDLSVAAPLPFTGEDTGEAGRRGEHLAPVVAAPPSTILRMVPVPGNCIWGPLHSPVFLLPLWEKVARSAG